MASEEGKNQIWSPKWSDSFWLSLVEHVGVKSDTLWFAIRNPKLISRYYTLVIFYKNIFYKNKGSNSLKVRLKIKDEWTDAESIWGILIKKEGV